MTASSHREARDLVDRVIAACLQPRGPAELALTEHFRCWTPRGDWEDGDAGLDALREVLSSLLSAPAASVRSSVTITDGELVVTELSSGLGGPSDGITLVLRLHAGLLDEARCYLDHRLLDREASPPIRAPHRGLERTAVTKTASHTIQQATTKERAMVGERERLGLVLGSAIAPEQLVPTAVRADQLGLDELWFSEDCFFTGAISGATAALASTPRIRIGLGIVSVMLRHPALLAMELSTMARSYPGRLTAGIGLGVPVWLGQLGRLPRSPLAALREGVTSVRALLGGERLHLRGDYFDCDDVVLAHPVGGEVPIHLGVVGERMLQLSGEVADGSILSVGTGATYLRWARRQIDVGRERGRRDAPHRITTFAIYAVADDRDQAREAVRGPLAFYLAAGGVTDLHRAAGVAEELNELIGRGGPEEVARAMPEHWIDELTVSGTPQDCARQIRALYDAGADSVALFPVAPDRTLEAATKAAAEVMPLLG